jgi:hypothetical protein
LLKAAGLTGIPQEFTAEYEVSRNGEQVAEVTISLKQQNDNWVLHGFTHDMQGLADVLNVKGSQTVSGQWQDGWFLPRRYDFSFSVIGYKTAWHADFDWAAGTVTTRSKSGKTTLPLTKGALDPFSLFLNTSAYIARNQTTIAVDVIDEDEIKNHVYQASTAESLDTPLGCLQTVRVERIRKNQKRKSTVWYANDHNNIPVLIRHAKKGGNGLSMQITSLELGGQALPAVPNCQADDSLTHRVHQGQRQLATSSG